MSDAGLSTCPVCKRTWLVTLRSDCMLPACGCYGDDTGAGNPNRPCNGCGRAHALGMPESCNALAAAETQP